MSATGRKATLGDFKEYTSGQSDTTTWAAPNLAEWVQVIGAGSVVVTTEAGAAAATPYNRTITTDSAEPAATEFGPFTALVSTTATRVRMGTGRPPLAISPPPTAVAATSSALGGVELTGGLSGTSSTGALPVLNVSSPNVSGVLPGPNAQQFADGGTTLTASYTAVVGTRYKINPTGAIPVGTLPAISSAIDGQGILLVNVATTGSTANTLAPTGNDNVGNPLATGTGATLAGPARGKAMIVVADNTLKQWLVLTGA